MNRASKAKLIPRETCWEHNQNMARHKKLIPQTLKVFCWWLSALALNIFITIARNYYFLADSTNFSMWLFKSDDSSAIHRGSTTLPAVQLASRIDVCGWVVVFHTFAFFGECGSLFVSSRPETPEIVFETIKRWNQTLVITTFAVVC